MTYERPQRFKCLRKAQSYPHGIWVQYTPSLWPLKTSGLPLTLHCTAISSLFKATWSFFQIAVPIPIIQDTALTFPLKPADPAGRPAQEAQRRRGGRGGRIRRPDSRSDREFRWPAGLLEPPPVQSVQPARHRAEDQPDYSAPGLGALVQYPDRSHRFSGVTKTCLD